MTTSHPTTTKAPRQARRVFDAAYKLQVAKMTREQGVSLNKVCTDMNLVPSALRLAPLGHWVAQLGAELAGNPGIGKPLTAEQQRIRVLEGQIRQLKSDNELLKKPLPCVSPGDQVMQCLLADSASKASSLKQSTGCIAGNAGHGNGQDLADSLYRPPPKHSATQAPYFLSEDT